MNISNKRHNSLNCYQPPDHFAFAVVFVFAQCIDGAVERGKRVLGFVKKLFLVASLAALCIAPARANIATVASVNEYISQRWDITMPATGARGVLDMSRLMQLIDTANSKLNGVATSDYAHDPEYATTKIVATNAATNAVDTLIQKKLYEPQFWFEPAVDGDTYEFYISAQGNYTIYWGDGKVEPISKPNTSDRIISHTYEDGKPASEHQIGLGGESFAYSTSAAIPVISFYDAAHRIKSIDGCLGCIFPTIDDGGEGKQPRFYNTFANNTTLGGEIPADLFKGISGQPITYMFFSTFNGCSGLTGKIPDGLFGELSGNAATEMFRATFGNCSGLTGKIPDGLFGNFTGDAANSMFAYTFEGCKGLTGIGDKIFGNFDGNAAPNMFAYTFNGCSGLTGKIPDRLFGNFTGDAANQMFFATFIDCKNLTGIGDNIFGNFNGNAAPEMFRATFGNCSGLTGSIPDGLFGNFTGDAANSMFAYTFEGCSGLTGKIPDGLFGNFDGNAATNMFSRTFYGCTSLTGPSATIGTGDNKQFLYELWPDATTAQVSNCYYNAKNLSDYDCIPKNWGGAGTLAPGECTVNQDE